MSRVRRAWAALRDEGWRSVVTRVLATAGYRRLILLQRPLDARPPELRASLPLTIDWLEATQAAECGALVADTPEPVVAERLRRGERCLAAWVDGELVAVMWASTGTARIPYLEMDLLLETGDVYLHGAFTAPRVRGQSIAPVLSTELMKRFHAEGRRRAVRGTMPGNAPALRAHAKAGFLPYDTIGRFQVGRFRREFRRPPRPA